MFIKDIKISNRLNLARTQSGLTQENLAKVLGVTRQTISAIEKGTYVPSIQLALKMAKYFKQPVESLFWLSDDDK